MSLFQQLDKTGHWNICGDGVVVAGKGGQSPIRESISNTPNQIPKVSFGLNVGYTVERNEVTGEKSYRSQIVNCAVYGTKGHELMYAFARTLQAGEAIVFWGKIWEKQNETDGSIYREIQISSILPIDHFLRTFLGTDGNDFAKLLVQRSKEDMIEDKKNTKRKDKGDLPF